MTSVPNPPTRCVWCLDEQHQRLPAGESSTICPRHRDKLLAEYWASVPRDDLDPLVQPGQGRRPDQLEFSMWVIMAIMLLLVTMGIMYGAHLAWLEVGR